MTKYITTLLLLSSFLSFGQIESVLLDAETKTPIPYVNIWIENENTGTTSSETGNFSFPKVDTDKYLIFSALGYETLRIQVSKIQNPVFLTPKIIHLGEVLITPRKGKQIKLVGNVSKKGIHSYFACFGTPWIVARYFKSEFLETPYIQKFKIVTSSDVKDAAFNVRLYKINTNGEPGEYLYDKNIVCIAKKGKKITEIDVSNINLKVPDEGFFFAVEWLVIDENRHEYTYTVQGSKKKKTAVDYSPRFGMIPESLGDKSWTYIKGKWFQRGRTIDDYPIPKHRGKVSTLAVEMTLTD